MRYALMLALAFLGTVSGGTALAQLAGSASVSSPEGDLKVVAVGYRASRLLHAPVYNEDGTRIGEVVDFVVTPRAYVSYMVVGVGGFLGLGTKDVAVPTRAFSIVDKKVVLPGGSKKALRALPAFHFSKL